MPSSKARRIPIQHKSDKNVTSTTDVPGSLTKALEAWGLRNEATTSKAKSNGGHVKSVDVIFPHVVTMLTWHADVA